MRGNNNLGMSLSIRPDNNLVPSAHTHIKQVAKVKKHVEMIKQQVKFEVDLCHQDEVTLNTGLQGIQEYEQGQLRLIQDHFDVIKAQIDREAEKMKQEFKVKV